MKMITAVVNRKDTNKVCGELNRQGVEFTRLATTGGFLRTGNTTLLIGVADEKLDEVIGIIRTSKTIPESKERLSDRFGLTVYFQKPNRGLYLDIVHELAERNGITLEKSQLDVKAEAFALARGSRSPRAAEQFIKSLL